jgi:hypothetical protein
MMNKKQVNICLVLFRDSGSRPPVDVRFGAVGIAPGRVMSLAFDRRLVIQTPKLRT